MGYDVPPRKFAYLPVNDDMVLVDVSTVQRYALLELARQGNTAASLELLADEYHEVHSRAYRLEGERDEAREWARKYKRMLAACKEEAYALIDKEIDLEMRLNSRDVQVERQAETIRDLERKYKQATCKHPSITTVAPGIPHEYSTAKCDDCGSAIRYKDWLRQRGFLT